MKVRGPVTRFSRSDQLDGDFNGILSFDARCYRFLPPLWRSARLTLELLQYSYLSEFNFFSRRAELFETEILISFTLYITLIIIIVDISRKIQDSDRLKVRCISQNHCI